MNIGAAIPKTSFQPAERIGFADGGKRLHQIREDFQSISNSLSSGDVTTAKSSFADLKKLLQSAGTVGAASTAHCAFDLLGKDLEVGDISLAQRDFARLTGAAGSSQEKERGQNPAGLPTRLPLYQVGLNAVKTAAGILG